jgi:hypothetical protein
MWNNSLILTIIAKMKFQIIQIYQELKLIIVLNNYNKARRKER